MIEMQGAAAAGHSEQNMQKNRGLATGIKSSA